ADRDVHDARRGDGLAGIQARGGRAGTLRARRAGSRHGRPLGALLPDRAARGAAVHRAVARPGRRMRSALGVALLVAAVLSCLLAAGARADGDPASDYLLAQRIFFPFDAKIPQQKQRELSAVVDGANRAGLKIRVALIWSSYDLGAITSLWKKPRTYARFLGEELQFVYKQRLLIVMPGGFGIYWHGHPVDRDGRFGVPDAVHRYPGDRLGRDDDRDVVAAPDARQLRRVADRPVPLRHEPPFLRVLLEDSLRVPVSVDAHRDDRRLRVRRE